MFTKIYYFLHKKLSKPEERGEYSAGLWQDAVREKVFSLCKDNQGKILEIGCGEGLFLQRIAKDEKFSNVIGLDIWRDILSRCRNRLEDAAIGTVKLVQADAGRLPFKAAALDSVVCINVFFNLASEEVVCSVLEEIARVCKKGGTVIFDIRNSLNPLLFLKYKTARFYDATVKNTFMHT
ncbi:MAG: class I SAM-dependent methyltransferase, partial [Candidatus Omnitrophica bacterium]|nr:class I SAM-dependent methyltransferase [Candidatus Omnitrophota bacterium]